MNFYIAAYTIGINLEIVYKLVKSILNIKGIIIYNNIRVFYEVFEAYLILALRKIRLPKKEIPFEIELNPKLFLYFRKILGAFNKFYFNVRIPAN